MELIKQFRMLCASPRHDIEMINSCFTSFNEEIQAILSLDSSRLCLEQKRLQQQVENADASIEAGSSFFVFSNRNVKLFTIGLLWNLIEYSTKFDFSSGENWFDYYLKERKIIYESLSLEMFYTRMGKINNNFYLFIYLLFISFS